MMFSQFETEKYTHYRKSLSASGELPDINQNSGILAWWWYAIWTGKSLVDMKKAWLVCATGRDRLQ